MPPFLFSNQWEAEKKLMPVYYDPIQRKYVVDIPKSEPEEKPTSNDTPSSSGGSSGSSSSGKSTSNPWKGTPAEKGYEDIQHGGAPPPPPPPSKTTTSNTPIVETYSRHDLINQLKPGNAFLPTFIKQSQQQEQLQKEQQEIDPNATYEYTDPNTGENRTVTGIEAKEILQEEIDNQAQQGREHIVTASNRTTAAKQFSEETKEHPQATNYRISPENGQIRPDMKYVSKENKIHYFQQQGTVTDPRTGKQMSWKKYKQQNPAAVLDTDQQGNIIIRVDYTQWRKQEYEQLNPTQATIRRGTARFLGGFTNWDYIIETVGHGKTGDRIIDRWEYEQQQRIKNNDYLAYTLNIPSVTNIGMMAAAGGTLSLATRGGGALTSYLTRKGLTTTGKVLNITGKAAKLGLGGAAITTVGTDLTVTALNNEKDFMKKLLTYGTQFASFGFGYKAGSNVRFPKVQREIVEYRLPGQPQRMVGQKYIEVFGRKIYSPKQVVATGPRQAPTYIRKGLGSGKTGFDVSPDLGYKTVGGKPTGIKNIQWKTDLTIRGNNWQSPVNITPKSKGPLPLPIYTIYPTITSLEKWNEIRIKDYKDFISNIEDPDYKVKPSIVSNKEWKRIQGKEKDFISNIADPDYKVKPSIVSNKEWAKLTPKEKTNRPVQDADVPVKPSVVTTDKWEIMRKKYKDIIKNIDDPNIILPIKKTTRWQPQTGLYYPLENPIVAAKNRLPIKYIFPGKPIRYGAYNTPYISILDQPMILESGAFTTTEGIVKVKRKPKITDLGKLFRENEKKLTQESKDQGYKETGQAGQEQETIQLLKTEQAQKTKTKILLQQQQQAQKQGQQTVSIFSPEYKVTAIGQKQYVMPSKVSKMYIPAAIKTAFDVQTKTAQAQKQKIDSLMATDLLSAQKQTQGLLSQSATLSLQSDATAQTTAQKQSSMQKQQQDTTMFYKTPLTNTMTPLWDLSIIKPTKNKQTKTKRISHGIPESEPETPTKQKSVNGKGYHVYVKKRHIVSGKTTGNKGYEQISRNPLNKKDALRLGANIVDTTPRATFLIKPTNKAAQPLRQNIPSWETQRKKFYKKNNRYIEKTKHRIDSPGELQGITVKGLEALDRQITSDLKQYRRRTRRLI